MLKRLYDLRSRLVHGGRVSPNDLETSLPLAEYALRKVWRWFFDHWSNEKSNERVLSELMKTSAFGSQTLLEEHFTLITSPPPVCLPSRSIRNVPFTRCLVRLVGGCSYRSALGFNRRAARP